MAAYGHCRGARQRSRRSAVDAAVKTPAIRMIIGIISDTHGYFHPAIPDYLSGVDTILHAGDVGTEDILDKLEALAQTYAVRGNIDGQGIRHRDTGKTCLIWREVRIWWT